MGTDDTERGMATLTGMNTPPSPACCVPIPPLSHETLLKAGPVACCRRWMMICRWSYVRKDWYRFPYCIGLSWGIQRFKFMLHVTCSCFLRHFSDQLYIVWLVWPLLCCYLCILPALANIGKRSRKQIKPAAAAACVLWYLHIDWCSNAPLSENTREIVKSMKIIN